MCRQSFLRIVVVLGVLGLASSAFAVDDSAGAGGALNTQEETRALELFNLSPAIFVENQGQWDDYIRYAFNGEGINVLFTDEGPVFQLLGQDGEGDAAAVSQAVVRAHFVGGRRVAPVGIGASATRMNYYIGSDASKWQSGVSTFTKVCYRNIYDGVDMYTWGRRSGLKYEFHVAPGASWEEIVVRYEGIEGLHIDEAGALHVRTALGEMIDEAPVVYQETPAGRVRVAARFRLVGAESYGFDVTGAYDESLPLVLDPDLAWVNYFGGSNIEYRRTFALDASGNAWVAGETLSSDFPTPGGFDTELSGKIDIFIVQITPSGELEWASYLGGSDNERCDKIMIDASGCAWLFGRTYSTDFPTPGGFDTSKDGDRWNGFAARITPTGELAWASYFGTGPVSLHLSKLDASGNVWIAVATSSPGCPTPGGFQTELAGGQEVYLLRITPSGKLAWASYLGGTERDRAEALEIDASGNVWVAGGTYSDDFPAQGGFDTTTGGDGWHMDGFVALITPSGNLAWSSYLGGNRDDWLHAMAIDASGNAWVAGETYSPDFPTPGGFQTELCHNPSGSAKDIFIARITPSSQLAWASYLGGTFGDSISEIAIDASGCVWITGFTSLTNFPTAGGFDTSNGYRFMARMTPRGEFIWVKHLMHNISQIVFDAGGNAWLASGTTSLDLPTPGGFDTEGTGANGEAYVAQITPWGDLAWASYFGSDDPRLYTWFGGAAFDASGNVWLPGSIDSWDPYVPSGSDDDFFVLKLTVSGDSDYDCLPDDWEMGHFGNLSQGPAGDPDRDGYRNIYEYQHATDPNEQDNVVFSAGRTVVGDVAPGEEVTASLSLDFLEGEEPGSVLVTETVPAGWVVTSTDPPAESVGAASLDARFMALDPQQPTVITWLLDGAEMCDLVLTYTICAPGDVTPGAPLVLTGFAEYDNELGNPVTVEIGTVVDVALDAVTEADPHIRIYFGYTLTDSDSDECAVELQYSFDGINWLDTDEPYSCPVGGPPVSSPEGHHNEWYWNTIEEPAPLRDSDIPIWVKVRAEDDDGFDEDVIGPFTVYNQPRTFFTDVTVWSSIDIGGNPLITDPTIVERGEEFTVSGTLNVRNFTVGYGPHPGWDTMGPVDFNIYLNGEEICRFSDRLGPELSPDDFSRPFYIYTQEEPAPRIAVPGDFPEAPSYTLSVDGSAYMIELDPFSTEIALAPARFITLTSPNGLEEWKAGSTHNIMWETYYPRASVHIYICKAGVYVDGEATEPDGQYEWAIPATLEPGNDYSVRVELSYDMDVFDWTDTDFTILPPDLEGPFVLSAATIPTQVREGVDMSLSLAATADDRSVGDSNIAAAEYFLGADPGEGNGTAMLPADGAFDEAVEPLAATVGTSSWTLPGPYRINLRALDAAGNWTSPAANIDVPVVDGTPPGAVSNLSVEAASDLPTFAVESWSSGGTVSPEEVEKTIDLGEVETIGAVGLVVGRPALRFPTDFRIMGSVDGVDWTLLTQADSFRPVPGAHIWQFEAGEYRYVKLVAVGRLNRRDKHYYVEIPEIAVMGVLDQAKVNATWTAPADDGYVGAPAGQYDLRYNTAPITPGNFDACLTIDGLGVPGSPGGQDGGTFLVDAAGIAYFALKTADEIPNWSDISNVAEADISAVGFATTAPPDAAQLTADVPPVFEFEVGAGIKPAFVEFSSTAGFIGKPVKAQDGFIYRTLRYPVKPGRRGWLPSKGQWKSIKKIVPADGTLYWRLSGKSTALGRIYGRMMTGHFDCGTITDLQVSPSHTATPAGEVDPWESVWPCKDEAPEFSWTNGTNGMKYFYVDISTDESMPMKDRKKSVTICRRGTESNSYTPNKGEWKKIRQLATWYRRNVRLPEAAEGRLYWRVRAADKDKTLSCASAVKPLHIDGGAFSGLDVNNAPGTGMPEFGWQHDGQCIVQYCLELCADGSFTPGAKYTLKVPARYMPCCSYTLKPGELKRLQKFADKNAATALHWRVRGLDADKKFVCYSESETWPVP